MITLTHHGMLLDDCPVAGERRADDRFPAHANAAQVSLDKFLIIYSTRGWRGTDDNTSIIYQLRARSYDGPVIAEGMLARSIDDWEPLEDGRSIIKAHLHPVVFGVPRGATVNGRRALHANVFVINWLRIGRWMDPATGFIANVKQTDPWLAAPTTAVESMQVRLNDDETDIEVVAPPVVLRQRGYACGYAFCEQYAGFMMQTFTNPVPLTDDASEWIGFNHFEGGRFAAMRYAFNTDRGVYEWVQTGPMFDAGVLEPSVTRWRDGWVIAARLWSSVRGGGPIAWMRWEDPFTGQPRIIHPPTPRTSSPITMNRCADGVIRLLTNDFTVSPYRAPRNPLYLWDIDPANDFAPSNRQVVFDAKAAGLPMRDDAGHVVDQAKVLPFAGGDRQFLLHRVRTTAIDDPAKMGFPVNDEEKRVSGVYYATMRYEQAYAAPWRFEESTATGLKKVEEGSS